MIRAKILGTGAAVPKKILTNADLEKLVETSDEWITTRTGIQERHIVSRGRALLRPLHARGRAGPEARARQGRGPRHDPRRHDLGRHALPRHVLPRPDATSARRGPRRPTSARRASGFSTRCTSPTASSSRARPTTCSSSAARSCRATSTGPTATRACSSATARAPCVLQATQGDHGILGSIMKSNGNYHDFICMPGRRLGPAGQRPEVDRGDACRTSR